MCTLTDDFALLPDEALFTFFTWVPPREIGRNFTICKLISSATCALVCKRWATFAQDKSLWKTFVEVLQGKQLDVIADAKEILDLFRKDACVYDASAVSHQQLVT